MRRQMPGEMHNAFAKFCPMDKETILDTLYHKPLPNRFLASFSRFASENRSHEYVQRVVRECFVEFFEQLVTRYDNYDRQTFNCIGSIGFLFSDLLSDVCARFNMKVGRFLKEPIDALVDYHLDVKS